MLFGERVTSSLSLIKKRGQKDGVAALRGPFWMSDNDGNGSSQYFQMSLRMRELFGWFCGKNCGDFGLKCPKDSQCSIKSVKINLKSTKLSQTL